MHKFLFYKKFIICLYMFQALLSSSTGGQNCIIQHLVSSHSVGGRPVHRTATYSVSPTPSNCHYHSVCLSSRYPFVFLYFWCCRSVRNMKAMFHPCHFVFKTRVWVKHMNCDSYGIQGVMPIIMEERKEHFGRNFVWNFSVKAENEDSKFIRNISTCLPNYTTSHPRT